MIAGFFLFAGGIVFLGGSALAAFCWAVRDGQLRNLPEASRTIFDDEEPVGVPTDKFPSSK
jgi:cbb3-type cytochrome oxidase maturation protein